MLASHLRRTTKPTRYALQGMPQQTPPEHQEAMRNFLALHTRAYDLPHMAHLASPHLQHPLIQSLLQSILGEHDPSAIPPLFDVAQEENVLPHSPLPTARFDVMGDPAGYGNPQLVALHVLMDNLAQAHHAMQGTHGAIVQGSVIPSPAEIHRRYATGALQEMRPQARLLWFPSTSAPLHDLWRRLEWRRLPQWQPQSPLWASRHRAEGAILRGALEQYSDLYDVLHAQQQRGEPDAGELREDYAAALRQHVLPLLHQGLI